MKKNEKKEVNSQKLVKNVNSKSEILKPVAMVPETVKKSPIQIKAEDKSIGNFFNFVSNKFISQRIKVK